MDEIHPHPAHLSSDVLGQYVEEQMRGVCQKLSAIRPYIQEVWMRIGRGEEILGCRTKEQFSERILHRTYGTVRHLMSERVPANQEKHPPVEITGSVFKALRSKVIALTPAIGDGVEHRFVELAERAIQTSIVLADHQTVEETIWVLRRAVTTLSGYADQLEQALRYARIA